MSTATKVKKAVLSMDKTLVDENNLEIPPTFYNTLFRIAISSYQYRIKAYHRKENRQILILQIQIYTYN